MRRNNQIRINSDEVKKLKKVQKHLEEKCNKEIPNGEIVNIMSDIVLRFIDDGHDLSKIHGLCKYSSYSINNNTVSEKSGLVPLFS